MKQRQFVDGPHGNQIAIDPESGEVEYALPPNGRLFFLPEKQQPHTEFAIVFQAPMRDVLKLRLPERELAIYMWCVTSIKWENHAVINQKEISCELNIAPSAVSTILRRLCERGLLIRKQSKYKENVYEVPMNIFWKDSILNWKKKKAENSHIYVPPPEKPV